MTACHCSRGATGENAYATARNVVPRGWPALVLLRGSSIFPADRRGCAVIRPGLCCAEKRMKRRAVKIGLLFGSGALLIQLGGCATVLIQLLIQNVVGQLIGTALSALITGANAANG